MDICYSLSYSPTYEVILHCISFLDNLKWVKTVCGRFWYVSYDSYAFWIASYQMQWIYKVSIAFSTTLLIFQLNAYSFTSFWLHLNIVTLDLRVSEGKSRDALRHMLHSSVRSSKMGIERCCCAFQYKWVLKCWSRWILDAIGWHHIQDCTVLLFQTWPLRFVSGIQSSQMRHRWRLAASFC